MRLPSTRNAERYVGSGLGGGSFSLGAHAENAHAATIAAVAAATGLKYPIFIFSLLIFRYRYRKTSCAVNPCTNFI
jgi:hypothetical protein